MSCKVKLFPLSSTREVPRGLPLRTLWSEPPAKSENAKVVCSLVVNNSDFPHDSTSGRSHRSIALGLALAFCVSASFWTGIAFVVARVWK